MKPAVWDDDPGCGHDVAHAYQTHYCTYIRVPRLLTLQTPSTPDELWLIAAAQWFELWFKVLLTDLRAALSADWTTFEPVKLLRRGVELYKLCDLALDLMESVAVRELQLSKSISTQDPVVVSEQCTQLKHVASLLSSPRAPDFPGLAQTIDEYCARLDAISARFDRLLRTVISPDRNSPTYEEWLHLPVLLDLQSGVKAAWTEEGRAPEDFYEPESLSADETMFVVVHQCFELWFRVLLDQIDRAIAALTNGATAEALARLRRVVRVQQLLVYQIQIPATMQPLDFMRFRHQTQERGGRKLVTGLSPASGTESYQFREIEIVCGLRDDAVFNRYLEGTDKLPIRLLTPRQAERLKEPTLFDEFMQTVKTRGLARLDDIYARSDVANPNADLAQLADTLIEFDEFFRLWRVNHLMMVERMIGGKSGTGFLGPEYLMETAGIRIQQKNRVFEERQVRPRFFEELWGVRTRLGAQDGASYGGTDR